jgi:hypothetical protein
MNRMGKARAPSHGVQEDGTDATNGNYGIAGIWRRVLVGRGWVIFEWGRSSTGELRALIRPNPAKSGQKMKTPNVRLIRYGATSRPRSRPRKSNQIKPNQTIELGLRGLPSFPSVKIFSQSLLTSAPTGSETNQAVFPSHSPRASTPAGLSRAVGPRAWAAIGLA